MTKIHHNFCVETPGLRFRKNIRDLPGKPDIVFSGQKVVIFCDGDFWHGRDWRKRKIRLQKGSNSTYWIAKISANRQRDQLQGKQLSQPGWEVIRLCESGVLADPSAMVTKVAKIIVAKRKSSRRRSGSN